jgi:hypothetical protein
MPKLHRIILGAACSLPVILAAPVFLTPNVADAADAAPTANQVKACVATLGPDWKVDWKRLDIGPARAPRNAFEAMNTSEMGQSRPGPGYPVRVVYVLNGQWTIDAEYFVIKNAAGRWQIPAVCTFPS